MGGEPGSASIASRNPRVTTSTTRSQSCSARTVNADWSGRGPLRVSATTSAGSSSSSRRSATQPRSWPVRPLRIGAASATPVTKPSRAAAGVTVVVATSRIVVVATCRIVVVTSSAAGSGPAAVDPQAAARRQHDRTTAVAAPTLPGSRNRTVWFRSRPARRRHGAPERHPRPAHRRPRNSPGSPRWRSSVCSRRMPRGSRTWSQRHRGWISSPHR